MAHICHGTKWHSCYSTIGRIFWSYMDGADGLVGYGAASTVGGVEVKLEPHRESVRLVGFESDSEDDDNGALAIDLNSGKEYGMDHVDGYDEDEILREIQ
ncbi:hypothetical protein SLEP1_g39135 [Rubroshorea leprosula]|uniref:Uncharacterized protein n=1 Tax=Rubroshorea leprosula TaxID=152421 RepID=A0AAV5L011_9ROSI|nr:hypothetical protein SLEP1_g39135 [Rubroshorea leprosula]